MGEIAGWRLKQGRARSIATSVRTVTIDTIHAEDPTPQRTALGRREMWRHGGLPRNDNASDPLIELWPTSKACDRFVTAMMGVRSGRRLRWRYFDFWLLLQRRRVYTGRSSHGEHEEGPEGMDAFLQHQQLLRIY